MNAKYNQSRPHVPAELRREAEIEAGHQCSVAHCEEHTYLDLHHIDGNRENNQINNVIILCPKHHRMAERAEIDRKALREYKRINRERAGLDPISKISENLIETYLNEFSNWLDAELMRMEKSPLASQGSPSHISPTLKIRGQATPDVMALEGIDNLLELNNRLLLLGNGGSGKTVTVLSWLRRSIEHKTLDGRLPVYISLSNLTVKTDLLALIRASFSKNGINLSAGQLENVLLSGELILVFDGMNEINHNAVAQGAIEDLFNFVNLYSNNSFLITSRYITPIQNIDLPIVDISAWDKEQIREYLSLRLGNDLGKATFQSLGDDLDFEWLRGNSIVGFCSNPLTLWMLATNVESSNQPPKQGEDIVKTLIDSIIRGLPEQHKSSLPHSLFQDVLEEFAYLMLDAGEILSLPFETAIEIAHKIIQRPNRTLPIPKSIDSYSLVSLLITAGFLIRKGERVEWIHQILQEHLSINFSLKRFSKFEEICRLILCPCCGYRADHYYDNDGKLWGICSETEKEFAIELPDIPKQKLFKRKINLIDRTGLPQSDDPTMMSVPKSYFDEGYMARLPLAGMLYMSLIGTLQNKDTNHLIDRHEIENKFMRESKVLFDLETWALVEAGILRLRHKNHITTVYVYSPPINPSARHYGYTLATTRHMNYKELEEDPEERFVVTSDAKEKYMREREEKNLPILFSYPFSEEYKHKVFRIAEKFGGQIRRTWGSYEEVIAEFPGEAWDFSKFASEEEFNEE